MIDLPQADALFQAVGVPPGAAPQAPPDNVIVVPMSVWQQWFDQQAVLHPATVHTQLHVRLDHSRLPSDPRDAYVYVQQLANNFEARVVGSAIVANNLAARLDAVREDALYARVLFLFLGLPGAILAIILTFAVSATGGDRRRREQALLRVRGATTPTILRLESLEAIVVSIFAVILALIITWLVVNRMVTIPLARHQTTVVLVTAVLIGIGTALAAVIIPAWLTVRESTVRSGRARVGRAGRSSILGKDLDRYHHARDRGRGILAHGGGRVSDRSRARGRSGDVGVVRIVPRAARALDRRCTVGD